MLFHKKREINTTEDQAGSTTDKDKASGDSKDDDIIREVEEQASTEAADGEVAGSAASAEADSVEVTGDVASATAAGSEVTSAQANGNELIRLNDIRKAYYIGTENELEVLHGVTLNVSEGEFTCIVGESGSGKSTLMNTIGLLDRPTSGEYFIRGFDVAKLSDDDLSHISNRQIGFVFQTYNLIARTSSLDNVAMPMLYAGVPLKERRARAAELLELVGMKKRMNHDPSELSGGQKQRVAIARALANDPAIILADEPTGALDSQTSQTVMDIFHKLHEERGCTILMITHSNKLAEECDRILTLVDGRITGERAGTQAHEYAATKAATAEGKATTASILEKD